jgi:hypothetical protein
MRDERCGARRQPATVQGRVDGDGDDVADPSLRVRNRQPQGQLGQALHGRLRRDELTAAKDEPDLGTVPVADDHRPACNDQLGDLFGELCGALLLPGYRARLSVEHECVAADCDQSDLGHFEFFS